MAIQVNVGFWDPANVMQAKKIMVLQSGMNIGKNLNEGFCKKFCTIVC
jgi:hypothetical protein